MNRQKSSRSKRSRAHRGIVTVEFALCIPVMMLITFGSIQLGASILLRHQAVAILETSTLNYILGSITEGDLPKHIRDLSEDSGLVGAEVTIAPVDDIFLNVQLSLPVRENIVAPMVIGGGSEIETSFLVYRP